MVSLDVVSLFTSVPLDYTIRIILDKVYTDKKVTTKLSRDELQTLLELCTKKMHFSFNQKIYKQTNGVAMGSPLGPVIANIFMVHLEELMIPTLATKMSSWYRYVDDTFTFIKDGEIETVQQALNNFHGDIKFTYESEIDNTISFLDVSVSRKQDGTFDTAVYRKKTDSSIYINWDAFATRQWKIGTLKGLFRRAFLVCSTDLALKKELEHLKRVFTKTNGYPSKIVHNTLEEIRRKWIETSHPTQPVTPPNDQVLEAKQVEVTPYICLPYKGVEGEKVIQSFKKSLRSVLSDNVKPRFINKGTKLGSFFSLKDKVESIHQTNLVYGYIPPDEDSLKEGYIGQTKVRFGRRTHEHAHTDKESAVFKNSQEKNLDVAHEDFQILEKGFPKLLDRRIAESLYVKEHRPKLNEQKDSFKLKLFN